MEDEFYISLPANSSAKWFKDNTNSHFFSKLQKRLTLKGGEWEIALTDLHYPRTWVNVPHGVVRIFQIGAKFPLEAVSQPKEISTLVSSFIALNKNVSYNSMKTIDLKGGGIDSVRELIKKIEDSLKDSEFQDCFDINYDGYSNKSLISVRPGYLVFMSQDLYSILGFYSDPSLVKGQHDSPNGCEPDAGFRTVYVYSDVIEKRIVGDTSVPLLRSIPTRGKRNTLIHESFLMRQYLKAAPVDTDNIEVRLTTDTGEDIPFASGLVFVNLHVRRVKNYRLVK